MQSYWKDFIEGYVNDPFYWFQPKGATVSPASLAAIQKKVRILKRFEGRRWRKVQRAYAAALQRAGLFRPKRARPQSHDFPAIARMNKKVFDSLGVAWITEQSIVQITEAGREFLRVGASDLHRFVHDQLCRYEFPNPSVGTMAEDAGVFPYLMLLGVLTHFPRGIPSACYELFISRIRSDAGLPHTVDRINRYLRLGTRERAELERRLASIPILAEGRLRLASRRTSLLNTIRLNKPYMLSLLKTPGLVVESADGMLLAEDRHWEAERLVQEHLRAACYIHFATEEDWVAFYGQPGRAASFEESLLYYRRRGDVERATTVFRRAKARRGLPAALQTLDEGEFRELHVLEKTLEDFLEFNLEFLEPGLRFVERQYPTSTGPLDILARDARKRWVVIELKRDRAADRVIGQLLRYRAFIVAERAKGSEHRVRGFVVAPQPDRRLVEAARGAPHGPPRGLSVYRQRAGAQALPFTRTRPLNLQESSSPSRPKALHLPGRPSIAAFAAEKRRMSAACRMTEPRRVRESDCCQPYGTT